MINLSNTTISPQPIPPQPTVVKPVPKDTTTDNVVQPDEAMRVGETVTKITSDTQNIQERQEEALVILDKACPQTDKQTQQLDKQVQTLGDNPQVQTKVVNSSKPEIDPDLQVKMKKSKDGIEQLTSIRTTFTNPTEKFDSENPTKNSVSPTDLQTPNHVIITRIMYKAVYTPEYLGLKQSQRDLTMTKGKLENQIKVQENLLIQLKKMEQTPEIAQSIKETADDLAFAKTKLKNTLKELDTAGTKMKEMETDGTARKHPATGAHSLSTWEQVKKEFIDTEGAKSKFFMTASIDFRRQAVDALIRDVAKEKHISISPAKSALLVAKILGSAALSSDRDINLTVRNAEIGTDTQLIKAVNERFREIFGQDPGTFFDTNLYNEGLMPDLDKNKLLTTTTSSLPELRDTWANSSAGKLNDSYQDIVALVKQRRFFSNDTEWNKYVDNTMTKLEQRGVTGTKLEAIKNQYNEANKFYHTAENEIAARVTDLGKIYPKATHGELELMASNDLYLQYMGEADLIKEDADKIKGAKGDPEPKLAEYRYKMGLAHYFANEAGMSEGVLRDVVINGQMLPDINKEREKTSLPPLKFETTSHQLMESFNENLGEMIKEFNHFSQDVGEGAYHSSKYAGRLSDCIKELVKNGTLDKNDPAVQKIQTFVEKLLTAAKKSVQITDIDGNPQNVGLLNIRKWHKLSMLLHLLLKDSKRRLPRKSWDNNYRKLQI